MIHSQVLQHISSRTAIKNRVKFTILDIHKRTSGSNSFVNLQIAGHLNEQLEKAFDAGKLTKFVTYPKKFIYGIFLHHLHISS